MVGELLGEGRLVARELLAVLRGEPHRVLVRDVHARDRLRLVLVHLARELAGELDRLHARSEGAAEGALNEALELRLDVPEHAHATAILRNGRPLEAACYGALGMPGRRVSEARAQSRGGHRERE